MEQETAQSAKSSSRRLVGGITRLAGGTAAGQAIAFVSIPVLSRLYSPADFGILAVYASLIAAVVVLITLRYEIAIPIAESDQDAVQLLGLSLVVSVLVAGVSALLVLLLSESISRWVNTPSLQPYLWLLPVSALAAGVYQAFNYWAIRKRKYARVALTKVTRNAWMVGSQLAVGVIKSGPLGLIVGDSLRWAGGSLSLTLSAWRSDRDLLRSISLGGMRDQARRHKKFPLLNAPSSLANSLGQQLPALIIAAFYGPFVAGSFYLVQKLLAVPITFLGRAISDAYVGEFAHLVRVDRGAASALFDKIVRALLLIGIIPALLLILVGEQISIRLLGNDWEAAGEYLQIVSVMFLAKFAVNPVSHTLVLLEQQGKQLVWDVSRMLLVNGGLIIVAVFGSGPLEAVWTYAVTMFVGYIILYAMCKRELSASNTVSIPATYGSGINGAVHNVRNCFPVAADDRSKTLRD